MMRRSDFVWPRPAASPPVARHADPRPARIVALRRERSTSIYRIHKLLRKERMPASLGCIRNVFNREGIRRLPHRPAHERAPDTVVADIRKLNLGPLSFHTDFAGLFLFALDLARMQPDPMLEAGGMPGSSMIPVGSTVRPCWR